MKRYLAILIVFIISYSCNRFLDFEIAKIDYRDDRLQRIFVVVVPEKVYDTLFIRQVICELQGAYPLNKKSSISFFSDKKYADYKTELFMDGNDRLPSTEIDNWMNRYYLGEFDCQTNQYITFPVSNEVDKRKTFELGCCQ